MTAPQAKTKYVTINTMTTKITKISVQRSDKAGNPFISSYTNKEQAKVGIQIDAPEFAGKWLSAFVELGDPIEQWKIGQTVDIVTSQKGNFWNFKVAKGVVAQPQNSQIWEKLFAKLDGIEQKIDNLEGVEPSEPMPEELPPF